MIEVEGISKWYGPVQALKDVSFKVDRGEIVGFLGPNGAGKTTMMKILTTFLYPDRGKARICDVDVTKEPLKVRNHVGYLPEHTPLYEDMDVMGFLNFIAQARGIPRGETASRMEEVIDACGLEDVKFKIISTLSKGYRQRVGLAQAMIHRPDVLVLDEPTSGLDPNQIQDIRDLIRKVGQERTVLLSTHILSEVQAVCNRVLIIHKGKLVMDDKLENIQKQKSQKYYVSVKGDRKELEKNLGKIENIASQEWESRDDWFALSLEAKEGAEIGVEIFEAINESKASLSELRSETRNLEDIFRDLTRE